VTNAEAVIDTVDRDAEGDTGVAAVGAPAAETHRAIDGLRCFVGAVGDDVLLVLSIITDVDAIAAVVVRAADGDAGVVAVRAPAAATHTTTGGLRTSSASSPTTVRSVLTTSPSPMRSSPAWCAPL